MTEITSYSGTHPYRERCLASRVQADASDGADVYYSDVAEQVHELDEAIAQGQCPRCGQGLPDHRPPAGSRVTACRCVPICPACGADEATTSIGPHQWRPTDPEFATERDQRLAAWEEAARPSHMVGDQMLTEDGVSKVEMRPHPGGWAEYGRDDEADR